MRKLNDRIEDGIASIFQRNLLRADSSNWKEKRAPHHHRDPISDHVLPAEMDIFTAGALDPKPSLTINRRGYLESISLQMAMCAIKVKGSLSKEERMLALHVLEAVVVYQRDFCRAYLQAYFPQDVRRHILQSRYLHKLPEAYTERTIDLFVELYEEIHNRIHNGRSHFADGTHWSSNGTIFEERLMIESAIKRKGITDTLETEIQSWIELDRRNELIESPQINSIQTKSAAIMTRWNIVCSVANLELLRAIEAGQVDRAKTELRGIYRAMEQFWTRATELRDYTQRTFIDDLICFRILYDLKIDAASLFAVQDGLIDLLYLVKWGSPSGERISQILDKDFFGYGVDKSDGEHEKNIGLRARALANALDHAFQREFHAGPEGDIKIVQDWFNTLSKLHDERHHLRCNTPAGLQAAQVFFEAVDRHLYTILNTVSWLQSRDRLPQKALLKGEANKSTESLYCITSNLLRKLAIPPRSDKTIDLHAVPNWIKESAAMLDPFTLCAWVWEQMAPNLDVSYRMDSECGFTLQGRLVEQHTIQELLLASPSHNPGFTSADSLRVQDAIDDLIYSLGSIAVDHISRGQYDTPDGPVRVAHRMHVAHPHLEEEEKIVAELVFADSEGESEFPLEATAEIDTLYPHLNADSDGFTLLGIYYNLPPSLSDDSFFHPPTRGDYPAIPTLPPTDPAKISVIRYTGCSIVKESESDPSFRLQVGEARKEALRVHMRGSASSYFIVLPTAYPVNEAIPASVYAHDKSVNDGFISRQGPELSTLLRNQFIHQAITIPRLRSVGTWQDTGLDLASIMYRSLHRLARYVLKNPGSAERMKSIRADVFMEDRTYGYINPSSIIGGKANDWQESEYGGHSARAIINLRCLLLPLTDPTFFNESYAHHELISDLILESLWAAIKWDKISLLSADEPVGRFLSEDLSVHLSPQSATRFLKSRVVSGLDQSDIRTFLLRVAVVPGVERNTVRKILSTVLDECAITTADRYLYYYGRYSKRNGGPRILDHYGPGFANNALIVTAIERSMRTPELGFAHYQALLAKALKDKPPHPPLDVAYSSELDGRYRTAEVIDLIAALDKASGISTDSYYTPPAVTTEVTP